MAARFEVGVLISLTDKLTRPMKAMADGFKRLGEDLRNSKDKFVEMNNQMKAAGATASKIGGNLTRKMTLPILGLGVAAVKTGMDFNKGMANVATLIPGNEKRVKELSDAMLKLSTETGTPLKDLTDGLYQTVSALGDSADTVERMRVVTKAAEAGLSTTTESLNLLSAVTKGYGDTSATALKKASDLSFVTVKLGQTTFPELASSMGRVIPLASALNVSQEELFATFATLTGVTGSAAEVSTQLRGAIQALMAPTGDMKKVMQAAGFASGQAMIQQLGLVGALSKLMASTGGNTEQMKKLFPSIEAMPAIMQLTGKGAQKFASDLTAMKDATGATDQAFKDQTQGVNKVGFAWKKMIATMKVMAIQIGQTLLPVVAQLASMFSGLFSVIAYLPGPVKAFLVGSLALLAAVGPILKLWAAWKKLQAGMAFLQTTKIAGPFLKAIGPMAGVLGKLLLLAAVIGTVVSLFGKNTIEVQQNIDASKELEKTVQDLASAYGGAAAGASKLTAEQRAQLQLRALETNEKLLNNMNESYDKMAKLAWKIQITEAGTREHEEAKIKLRALSFAYERDTAGFKRTQQMLGRSDAETKAAIGGLGTGLSRAVMGDSGTGALSYARSEKSAGQFTADLVQALAKNPLDLKGRIFVHVRADGTVQSAAEFPGSKVGADISAQSVKNGRTR